MNRQGPKETRSDELPKRHKSNDKENTRGNETDSNQETRVVVVLRFILYLVIFGALGGKFFTGSYLWEYDGKWIRLRTYFPVSLYIPLTRAQYLIQSSFSSQLNVYSLKQDLHSMAGRTPTNLSMSR